MQPLEGNSDAAHALRIGYKALRRAVVSREDARQYIQQADEYFSGLGATGDFISRRWAGRNA